MPFTEQSISFHLCHSNPPPTQQLLHAIDMFSGHLQRLRDAVAAGDGEALHQTFSHAKAIYKQPKFDIAGLAGMRPPYNKKTESSIKMQTKV